MILANIRALTARGFRRFDQARTFSLVGPDGTVLPTLVVAGPNGIGKSSFFEAILYALGREDLLQRQLSEEHRIRWLQAAVAPDAEVRLSLNVRNAPGTILGARAPCDVEVFRSRSIWRVLEGAEKNVVAEQESLIRQLLNEVAIQWFSSWRQPYLCGPVRPMAVPAEDVGEEAGRLWQVKQRLVDERARHAFDHFPGKDIDWLEGLNRAWVELRGEDGTHLALGAAQSHTDYFDLVLRRLDPEFGDIDICPIDQLSSGELEWIALVGTLITTNFEGIVLVDEPELHMHPEWQARLLPALRSVAQESQIIIATHADPPWDQVYSFERLLMVPPGDPRSLEADE